MKKSHVAAIAVLAVVAIVVYALLHLAVDLYLLHATGFHFGWWLAVGGTISFLSIFIARWQRNAFTELIAIAGSIWMGSIFIAFIVFFPLDVLAGLTGIGRYPAIVIPAVIALILLSLYLARSTRVKEVTLPLRGITKPFLMVQLTDLHIGDIYQEDFLEKTVDTANSLQPDLVVITGDLFDGAGKLHSGMIDSLRDLKCPALYVNGNHEVYEGLEITNAMIDRVGVKRLDDKVKTVGGIQFIGLSYPEEMAGARRDVLKSLVAACESKKPMVLLRHEPRDVKYAAKLGIDLQLSGHTHNGQLWPLGHFASLLYTYRVGLHRIGNFYVYVAPGTGTWGPPMRLGSRSEITLFRLEPKV